MKPNYITILITALCITFNACQHSSIIPQLQLADALMHNHSDSALNILQKLSIEEMPNSSARATYALLLTEALDKNELPHHDNSLVSIAVDYYKNSDKDNLKTKAYYYLEEYIKTIKNM